MEGYSAHLVKKQKRTAQVSGVTITDSVHIKLLPVIPAPPTQLQDLIDNLSGKPYYEGLFVRDCAPPKRIDRYHYIHLLERGLPFHAILYTHSIGGSIGVEGS